MTSDIVLDKIAFKDEQLLQLIYNIREPLHIIRNAQTDQLGLMTTTDYAELATNNKHPIYLHIGALPAIYPEWLGSQHFLLTHGTRFPYIVGEMANGIATAQMVIAAAQAGMIGFFGAAGLAPAVIEHNLDYIQKHLAPEVISWGANLIHSPHEPHLEQEVVNLFLQRHVRRISASAYMSLSSHIVHYACSGLFLDPSNVIHRRNHVFAKISRPEVAKLFMSPPPAEILNQLVNAGKLTSQEAKLAAYIPIAEDITVEADSGGHTDNRPLCALFPTIYALAEQISKQYNYAIPIRVGAAGSLGTPASVAAAFSMGAAYVLTGSINQATIESGLSETGKELLTKADIADVTMAPAADMFELGVKLQVLKRGTLFANRASKLYEIYSQYPSLEAIPEIEKTKLEQKVFAKSFSEIWELTQQFFAKRDPKQIERALQNPKYRMGLVFRWYLGLSSQWAIQGNIERKMDYQIWCGPAMGAFNQWVAGTFLEPLANRNVAQIGRNLLEGAAIIIRAQQLRSFGMTIPSSVFNFKPRPLA